MKSAFLLNQSDSYREMFLCLQRWPCCLSWARASRRPSEPIWRFAGCQDLEWADGYSSGNPQTSHDPAAQWWRWSKTPPAREPERETCYYPLVWSWFSISFHYFKQEKHVYDGTLLFAKEVKKKDDKCMKGISGFILCDDE